VNRFKPRHGLLLAALYAAACTRGQTPQQLTITAVDGMFLLPGSAAPGPTLIRFVNNGTKTHEVRLFRFKTEIGEDSARALLRLNRFADSLADSTGAALIAAAHSIATQQVLANLKPNEIYGLVCALRDSTNAPRHDRLKEFAVLPVRDRR